MLLHFLFVIIGCVAVGGSPLQSLFPDLGHRYKYALKASVASGFSPQEGSSSWSLDGKLIAQVYNNFTTARFQLQVRKLSVSSNDQDTLYIEDDNKIAEYLGNLTKPWEAEFSGNGLIKTLYVDFDSVWNNNIKRALSLNFQIFQGSGTMLEPCLGVSCQVTYVKDGYTLKKYTRSSMNSYQYLWSSVPLNNGYEKNPFSAVLENGCISTAERIYTFDELKGLVTLDLKGTTQYRTQEQTLSAITDLQLSYESESPGMHIEKLYLQPTNLDYDGGNSTFNYQPQDRLRNQTYEILLRISRKGIDVDNLVRNASVIHNMDFINLLDVMTQLNYESLKKIFEDLVLGTSYDLETARNIFLEVLPHARNTDCARFIKHLVTEQKDKIEDAIIISLLRKLPFNVAYYSQELLQELEVFTKFSIDFPQDIRYAGILSFATLLYQTKTYGRVKSDYLDDIVVKYFRMYNDCPLYLDRLIWLQGLCNIGYSADPYIRTIYTDNNADRYERFWASLSSTQTNGVIDTIETTIPIIMNDKEYIHLRIVALHVFLTLNSGTNDFLFIHHYIQGCDSKELKKFWYSTLQSLRNNKSFNDYPTASYLAPIIASQTTNLGIATWATDNYIISSEDSSAQFLSVADPRSAMPSFAGFKMTVGKQRPFKASVYVIVEGVLEYLGTIKTLASLLDLDAIMVTLKKMKVPTKPVNKFRVDLVIKVQDKTVYATHFNESVFDSRSIFNQRMDELFRSGSHINQQLAYYPYQLQIVVPTELGTPVKLQSTTSLFTSIRGNITSLAPPKFFFETDFHLRYQGNVVTSLTTESPLTRSRHTASLQNSMVNHIPIKFNTIEDSNLYTIQWPLNQSTGIAMHTRPQIQLISELWNHTYSPRSGQFSNEVLFDCNDDSWEKEIPKRIWPSNRKNQMVPYLHQMLINGFQFLISPPPGSCGLILKPDEFTPSNGHEEVLTLFIKVLEVMMVQLELKLAEVQAGRLVTKYEVHISPKVLKDQMRLTVRGRRTQSEPENAWTIFHQWHEPIEESRLLSHVRNGADEANVYSTTKFFNKWLEDPPQTEADKELSLDYKFVAIKEGFDVKERYIKINIIGRNLSLEWVFRHLYTDFFIRAANYIDQEILDKLYYLTTKETINTTLAIKEKNGQATLFVDNSPGIPFTYDDYAHLLSPRKEATNTYGFSRTCHIRGDEVKTLTGSSIQLPASQCESLILADCSFSSFVVTRLKDGTVRKIIPNIPSTNGLSTDSNQAIVDTLLGLVVGSDVNGTDILATLAGKTLCGACVGEYYEAC